MERTSALMDGELDARQSENEIARLGQDPAARSDWEVFHLIGDAMRGNRAMAAGVARRVSERLAQEPTVLAPRAKRPTRAVTYALSAAASLSAVALVGWVALQSPARGGEQAAGTPPAPAAPADAAPQLASVPSDGRMNDYLMAHQAFSPSTSLQGLAAYIRTISAHSPAERATPLPAAEIPAAARR